MLISQAYAIFEKDLDMSWRKPSTCLQKCSLISRFIREQGCQGPATYYTHQKNEYQKLLFTYCFFDECVFLNVKDSEYSNAKTPYGEIHKTIQSDPVGYLTEIMAHNSLQRGFKNE